MSAFNASNALVAVYTGAPSARKIVSRQTDCTFSRSKTSIDISSKTSSRYGEKLSGGKSGTISFDAFIETAPGAGEVSETQMEEIFESDVAYKWSITPSTTGAMAREVFAIMTKFDLKYAKDTGAQYSIELEITGAPTATAVA